MPLSSGPTTFGATIAQIRRSNGLIQKQIAERTSPIYSDERAYRRVESGERLPARDDAITILVKGLEVTEIERINDALKLAGYAPLTVAETHRLQLALPLPIPPAPRISPKPKPRIAKGGLRPAGVILGALVVSSLVAALSGNSAIMMATAMLYASLYAVSVLLETSFDPTRPSVWPIAVSISGAMLVSSVLALVADAWLVNNGNRAALAVSFAIYFGAAIIQWFMARGVLPESAVVPLQFQAHTAQTAHLKNTVYFLVIVVLFWLPPFHCVMVLQRETRLGNASLVKALVTRRLIQGGDVVALGREWLWWIFLGLGLLAIPMAVRLLENLRAHPGLNTYTALLYLRAVLYFALVLVCLIWYSSAVGSLQAT